jgi:hypothetical protein
MALGFSNRWPSWMRDIVEGCVEALRTVEELPTQSLLRDFCDSELRSVFKDFRKAGTCAMMSRL